jgi:hypothetical protein
LALGSSQIPSHFQNFTPYNALANFGKKTNKKYPPSK